jgi:type IV pilus assembly protein PilN
MIRINLLPHREMARERRRKEFVNLIALTALLALTTAIAVALGIDRMIETQSSRNGFITQENGRLDGEIKEIGQLRQEIEALMARQTAVESLQRDRTIPVRVFDELARRTPNGMVLRQIRQDDRIIALSGWAQSNGQVSALLRALATETEWLERPELLEIKAGQMPNPSAIASRGREKDMLRVFEFSMTAQIKPLTPTVAGKPGSGASSQAAGAPASGTQVAALAGGGAPR